MNKPDRTPPFHFSRLLQGLIIPPGQPIFSRKFSSTDSAFSALPTPPARSMNDPASDSDFFASARPPQFLTKSAATSISSTKRSSAGGAEGFDSEERLAIEKSPGC